jgi:hypothetical protein
VKEETKESCDMDEDEPLPEPKGDIAGKSKNPYEKKSVAAFHSFLGRPSAKAKKSALWALNAILPTVSQYVKWSKKPITWDWKDHPELIPMEHYTLVVNPRIDGYDFSKCLMDGGASLNIMYLETLKKMNLLETQLRHSNVEFHGVVLGRKGNSLGSIKLPVAFGDVNNYREEMIKFEVVPFKSSYHMIFGRPSYHKFHARACYIYNKLKIPGPNGTITIHGNYMKAQECEEVEAAFAESVLNAEELTDLRNKVDPAEISASKKQISDQNPSFKAADETKKVELIDGDSSKTTTIGAAMDPK